MLKAAAAVLCPGVSAWPQTISINLQDALPSFSLDYFYGIDANQAARNFGSSAQATTTRPVAESVRLTLLRYEAEDATALEVVDAQSTLAQARNAYDDGLARYRLAPNIQTLTGTP